MCIVKCFRLFHNVYPILPKILIGFKSLIKVYMRKKLENNSVTFFNIIPNTYHFGPTVTLSTTMNTWSLLYDENIGLFNFNNSKESCFHPIIVLFWNLNL